MSDATRCHWSSLAAVLVVILATYSVVDYTFLEDDTEQHVFDVDGGRDEDDTAISKKFVVLFDLGSSGTRAYVFQYEHQHGMLEYAPHPDDQMRSRRKIRPGVSSIALDDVGEYLDDQLEWSADVVARSGGKVEETPILLFATAGLRMMKPSDAEEVLERIRSRVTERWPFRFQSEWARVLSGGQEAVFGWIGVQHVMQHVDWNDKPANYGVLDMGGGSVQMVLSIHHLGRLTAPNVPAEFAFDTTYLNASYTLYGNSYLGYGFNAARAALTERLAMDQIGSDTIDNPCLQKGFTVEISTDSHTAMEGSGDYEQCRAEVRKLFMKSECIYPQCSFNNIYQPIIGDKMEFIATDNFARVVYVLNLNPIRLELQRIAEMARIICQFTKEELLEFVGNRTSSNFPPSRYCFEATYGYELLTYGFNLKPTSRQVSFLKEIDMMDFSWAVGAAMYAVHNDFELE